MTDTSSTLLPFAQAHDWFYVYTGPTNQKAIDRVAVWARLLDDKHPQGVVVGLVAVRHDAGQAPCLVMPSTSEGCYVHLQDLSQAERTILAAYHTNS